MSDVSIDLSFAQGILEGLMLDTLLIEEDERDTRDDTVNGLTGELVPVTPPVEIYSGVGMFRPIFRTPPMMEGGQLTVVREYLVSIPIIDDVLKAGQRIVCTSSTYDPGIVGKVFRLIEVQYKTFAVKRTVRAELRDDIRDR